MLQTVTATRYLTPLREGGSLPGLVEADDLGTYVMKFRGAGQGPKALVAEVIVTELARRMLLPVPELRVIELRPEIAKYEADEEVQDLLNASLGPNLGVDFLPGSFGWDASFAIDPELAAKVLWLDAFTANVDRSWRNPNLLIWHRSCWLIDHGAALIFHHRWANAAPDLGAFVNQPYKYDDHVFADYARAIGDGWTVPDSSVLTEVVAEVPGAWLETSEQLRSVEAVRQAYVHHLTTRAGHPAAWLPR